MRRKLWNVENLGGTQLNMSLTMSNGDKSWRKIGNFTILKFNEGLKAFLNYYVNNLDKDKKG